MCVYTYLYRVKNKCAFSYIYIQNRKENAHLTFTLYRYVCTHLVWYNVRYVRKTQKY